MDASTHDGPPADGGSGSRAGLTLTTAAFLFLLLRLFAVTDHEWGTAFAVLHTLDLEDSVGIVLGTVMADSVAAAVALALLVPLVVFRTYERWRRPRRDPWDAETHGPPDLVDGLVPAIALVIMATYVWSFHAWWLPPAALLVGVVFHGLQRGARPGGRRRRAVIWAGHHLGTLLVTALLVGAATVSTPWVPQERIALRGGTEIRGYVMQAEPGFLKVLTAHDRAFRILADSDVTARTELADH
ncbi:hypothetical protein ACF053_24960 [Streptomyces kanasensis]|uniref:hypothetical protein n=1 Tax=Streptomyces kanasensis TaxID=936756 RepID=UPI0036F81DD4